MSQLITTPGGSISVNRCERPTSAEITVKPDGLPWLTTEIYQALCPDAADFESQIARAVAGYERMLMALAPAPRPEVSAF